MTCESAKPILIIIHYSISIIQRLSTPQTAGGFEPNPKIGFFLPRLNVHCRLRQTAKGEKFFCSPRADVIIALSESENPLEEVFEQSQMMS